MVQYFGETTTRTGRLSDILGQALGKGLTDFTNTYYANKDLERVLSDPNLEGASSSKRLGALQRALSRHGDIGQNLFKNRLQVEQTAMEEESLKRREAAEARANAFREREISTKERQAQLAEEKLNQKERQQQELMRLLGISPSQTTSQMSNEENRRSSDLSDRDILALGVQSPQLANLLEKQKEFKQRQELQQEEAKSRALENKIKRESAVSTPVLQRNSQSLASLPVKRSALKNMEQAIESGETEGIIPYLVDVTGFEPFRNASSAQLKTAGKEYFLSNISRAGSRPNQWIEQQIASAFPQIGRSKEGNLTSLALLEYQQDIEEKRATLINDLADKYEKELGYVPANIERQVDKELLPYGERQEKVLAYKLRKIYEDAHPSEVESTQKVRPGTPLTFEKAKVFRKKFGTQAEQVAKKLGYDIEIPEGFEIR